MFYLLLLDVLFTFTNYVTVRKNSLINEAHMMCFYYYSNIFTNNQFSACLILSLSIPPSKLIKETEANIEPKMDSFRKVPCEVFKKIKILILTDFSRR